LREPPGGELCGKPVLLLSGAMDPIVTASESDRLARLLQAAGADVRNLRLAAGGHGLSEEDEEIAKAWFASLLLRP
jgi:phospholipase/carboxylesterase